MKILDRLKSLIVTKAEGDVTSGPWYLPYSNGWLSADVGSNMNWWQRGGNIQSMTSPSAIVEACVSAYAQTVAMCPGDHWWTDAKGGRERVTNSALYRILRQPNAYQTTSDFLVNAVRNLYTEGNAYALALRNSRYEISELHLMDPRNSAPIIAETGEVFYSLGGNVVIDRQIEQDYPFLVPARDVLHLRINTQNYNPLQGISPIAAAAMDIAAGNAMLTQQIAFYMNQARPSFVLQTDMVLDKDQVQFVRDRWQEQVAGMQQGGTPILTAGLKPAPLSVNSVDAQLAEIMKLSEQHVALAFRIPLQVLGISGSPTGSTEALMQGWLNGSLGFALNHIETSIDKMFGLKGQPDEYTEFSTDALLRSSMKERIETFARSVTSGIHAPDEARAEFGLSEVDGGFGHEPRVQQQVVPLSAAAGIPSAPPAPPMPGPAAPPAPKEISNVDTTKQWAGELLACSFEYDRRRAS